MTQGLARMADREVDQQLVERAQRGDKRAFELLVLKYQHKVVKLVMRYLRDPADAEDVAQEAFIKAYRALPQFRGDSAIGILARCRCGGMAVRGVGADD